MSEPYFVKNGSGIFGPCDSAKLKELAAAGKITTDSLIRRGTQGSWHPASKVRGLHLEEPQSAENLVGSPPVFIQNAQQIGRPVQTIQKTAKTWKLFMLIGTLGVVSSFSIGSMTLMVNLSDVNSGRSSDNSSGGWVVASCMLVFIASISFFIVGRFGKWWYHD